MAFLAITIQTPTCTCFHTQQQTAIFKMVVGVSVLAGSRSAENKIWAWIWYVTRGLQVCHHLPPDQLLPLHGLPRLMVLLPSSLPVRQWGERWSVLAFVWCDWDPLALSPDVAERTRDPSSACRLQLLDVSVRLGDLQGHGVSVRRLLVVHPRRAQCTSL